MALITTGKTIGWYGTHGENPCQPLYLPSLIGSYNANKQFIMGTSGFSEEEAEKINVWHSNAETGMPETWSLRIEKALLRPMVIQNPSLDLLAEVENLECGQIYWIDYRQKQRFNTKFRTNCIWC